MATFLMESKVMTIENQKHIDKETIKQIDKLKKYESNARTHSAKQIEQIKNSISEFRFTNPLLIDSDNTLIAGHCRLEAAKLMQFTELRELDFYIDLLCFSDAD